jgi:putative membrane protein
MGNLLIFKNFLITTVALQHIGFLILEIFFWTKPLGLKVFGMSQEVANSSQALAANQGLYNGFLAVGLFWSFFLADPSHQKLNHLFFLSCVIVAGTFGAWTVHSKIFWIQAGPAFVALGLTLLYQNYSS